mmetsp:Transcript_19157/g.41371  ORF Transcript_19157/g.41371 Transcript_19157/m.41371 type:complete len:732 (+) Transcript_19157:137-2332(+)
MSEPEAWREVGSTRSSRKKQQQQGLILGSPQVRSETSHAVRVEVGSDAGVTGPLRPHLEKLRAGLGAKAPASCKNNVYALCVDPVVQPAVSAVIRDVISSASQQEMDVMYRMIQPQARDFYMSPHTSWAMQQLLTHARPEQKSALVEALRGSVVRVANHLIGNHGLRVAMEAASYEQQCFIMAELTPSVHKLMTSPHGTFSIQQTLRVMPPELNADVARAVLEAVPDLLHESPGCYVVQALVEGSAPDTIITQAIALMAPQLLDLLQGAESWKPIVSAAIRLEQLPDSPQRSHVAALMHKSLMAPRQHEELHGAVMNEHAWPALGPLLRVLEPPQRNSLMRRLRAVVDDIKASTPKLKGLKAIDNQLVELEQELERQAAGQAELRRKQQQAQAQLQQQQKAVEAAISAADADGLTQEEREREARAKEREKQEMQRLRAQAGEWQRQRQKEEQQQEQAQQQQQEQEQEQVGATTADTPLETVAAAAAAAKTAAAAAMAAAGRLAILQKQQQQLQQRKSGGAQEASGQDAGVGSPGPGQQGSGEAGEQAGSSGSRGGAGGGAAGGQGSSLLPPVLNGSEGAQVQHQRWRQLEAGGSAGGLGPWEGDAERPVTSSSMRMSLMDALARSHSLRSSFSRPMRSGMPPAANPLRASASNAEDLQQAVRIDSLGRHYVVQQPEGPASAKLLSVVGSAAMLPSGPGSVPALRSESFRGLTSAASSSVTSSVAVLPTFRG